MKYYHLCLFPHLWRKFGIGKLLMYLDGHRCKIHTLDSEVSTDPGKTIDLRISREFQNFFNAQNIALNPKIIIFLAGKPGNRPKIEKPKILFVCITALLVLKLCRV